MTGFSRELFVEDTLDDDGDLEVHIVDTYGSAYSWIDKERAILLIEHLQRMFDI